MKNAQPLRITTITEYHRVMGLPKPEHPLISVINLGAIKHATVSDFGPLVFDFYSISMKKNFNARVRYGQQVYDFDEGIMFFISPGQVFKIESVSGEQIKRTGWMLLVHPDFLWNTSLAKTMKQYEFFGYSVHEALFLSDKEEQVIMGMMEGIAQEYHANIDKFTQSVMIGQLELLLTYADRFYHRQFITRKISNHQILDRLENLLTEYFESTDLTREGLPSVQYVADALNVSPNYLSGLLKVLTGQSTQQHIHSKLIDKAKEQLSTTNLSVSEIAYALGFEHTQSFSKLFKSKTSHSPLEFRQSFN